VAWASRRWPAIDWRVCPLDADSASVLASAGGGDLGGVPASTGSAPADLLLYSHLDTSLTGDPATDAEITGRADPLPELRFDPASGIVSGPGLGVAKAPAAAAVVGFVRAAERLGASGRVQLLLAARGTHRTDWSAPGPHRTGVTEYLASRPKPGAAVIAKCGPPGILWQEPAALYLRVRAESGWGPLMSPGALRPVGGLLASADRLLAEFGRFSDALVAAYPADQTRQDGAAFGLGALRAGATGKADLAPAWLELFGYAAMPGPITPGATAAALQAQLREQMPGLVITVEERLLGDGPATASDAPVVRAATDAYLAELGRYPEPITGWTGSTDGVVFRAAGVDTARLGPRPLPAGPDPRVDAFDLAELARFARVYEAIIASQGDPSSHLT
jgi:hypothetical protein